MTFKSISIFCMILLLSFGPAYGKSPASIGDENPAVESDREQESAVVFTHAERRDSRPFQLQVLYSFGPATPHSFAPGAGLHLGVQVSKSLYVGLTSSAFAEGRNILDDRYKYSYDDEDDKRYQSDKIYGQKGAEKTESELDPIHLLEMRITPWDFGLYFTVGLMHRGKQTSTTEFKTQSRTLNENPYTTGLTATVDYEEWLGAATGIGFNYIFDCGLTLGTAMTFGIGGQTPEVTVSSTAAVSEEDLSYWKKQIKANEAQLPYLYTFSLGYAF